MVIGSFSSLSSEMAKISNIESKGWDNNSKKFKIDSYKYLLFCFSLF